MSEDNGAQQADGLAMNQARSGLGHSAAIPSALLEAWGYIMAEAAGWLRAASRIDSDPDAADISARLTKHYAEVARIMDDATAVAESHAPHTDQEQP